MSTGIISVLLLRLGCFSLARSFACSLLFTVLWLTHSNMWCCFIPRKREMTRHEDIQKSQYKVLLRTYTHTHERTHARMRAHTHKHTHNRFVTLTTRSCACTHACSQVQTFVGSPKSSEPNTLLMCSPRPVSRLSQSSFSIIFLYALSIIWKGRGARRRARTYTCKCTYAFKYACASLCFPFVPFWSRLLPASPSPTPSQRTYIKTNEH
jgi:hypothetical protein